MSESGGLRKASSAIDGVAEGLGEPDRTTVEPEREAWLSHEEFEGRFPDFREAAERDEATRVHGWVSRHGTVDGYAPWREFPCRGTLRVWDEDRAIMSLECDRCGFEVSVPIEQVMPGKLVERRLERAGIPEGFLERRFEIEPYHERVLTVVRWWVRDFAKERVPAPGFIGEPGRGKTHLLATISRDLIVKHGVDLMFRSSVSLWDELQAALGTDAFEIKWERLCTVPVLVLDDLGAERRSEWRDERLAQLIDRRYSACQSVDVSKHRPILMATNVAPNVWPEVFGDRPASRLRAMVQKLRVEGPDRRAGMGVQEALIA